MLVQLKLQFSVFVNERSAYLHNPFIQKYCFSQTLQL